MNNHPEVIAAIQAGDLESLRVLLAETPVRAWARDEAGVSAILHALYRRRADMVDLLLAARPELDIFEAASLGRVERAAELLQQEARRCKRNCVNDHRKRKIGNRWPSIRH